MASNEARARTIAIIPLIGQLASFGKDGRGYRILWVNALRAIGTEMREQLIIFTRVIFTFHVRIND